MRLQPSEVENMCYYEFEYITQNLIDILKEKQEAEEKQSKDYGDMNPQSMMKNMPNMGNFKPPSLPSQFNIPNLK